MNRIYFASDSLERVEDAERILTQSGVSPHHFHLFSNDNDNAKAESKGLHTLNLFEKTNVLSGLSKGFAVGILLFILTISAGLFTNLADTYTWTPIVMLSLFVLGFSTWEAGLYGAQQTNASLTKHEQIIKDGRHVFYVDCPTEQTAIVCSVCHDKLHMDFI